MAGCRYASRNKAEAPGVRTAPATATDATSHRRVVKVAGGSAGTRIISGRPPETSAGVRLSGGPPATPAPRAKPD